jgi:protein-tyrosine phosphatase
MIDYLRAQWQRLFGLNISQIEPLLFVGGQFHPEQWPLLRDLGVRAVLSMQAEHEDHYVGDPPERTLRLQVPDFTAPTQAQLLEGVAFIAEAHGAHLPVFIHCHAGVGRAPIMAAAYLVAQHSLSHDDALARLRAARPIIGPNPLQMRSLREFEQHARY